MKMYELVLQEKIKRTEDTYSLRFRKNPYLCNFKPGQFLILKFSDKETQRAYSISSAPSDPYLEITVRGIGEFSRRLNAMKVGDKVLSTKPKGNMIYDNTKDDLVFIAAGTGISPFLCIIRHILANNYNNKIVVLYSCKNQQDIIFREELEQFSKNKNIKVYITLTREPQDSDWKGERGRLDKEKIKACTKHLIKPLYFIVGQKDFVIAMKNLLNELGIHKERIKNELW